jgi:hypothetical protein
MYLVIQLLGLFEHREIGLCTVWWTLHILLKRIGKISSAFRCYVLISRRCQMWGCEFCVIREKCKAVPLSSIEAHLGDRRYSSCSFLIAALEGGEWSASRPGLALLSDKEPPVPIVQEAWWAPEPVWTQRLEEKPSVSVGDRTPAVQSSVRHCTDWATPAFAVYLNETPITVCGRHGCCSRARCPSLAVGTLGHRLRRRSLPSVSRRAPLLSLLRARDIKFRDQCSC